MTKNLDIRKHIENRINKMNKRYSDTEFTAQTFTKQNNKKVLEQDSMVLGKK